MRRQIILLSIMFLTSLSSLTALTADQRMYIDAEELCERQDAFRIHIGHNNWIETDTVHRDRSGMYIFINDIHLEKINDQMEYQKSWKCPYCFYYWPIGTPCGNAECPSKYKFEKLFK